MTRASADSSAFLKQAYQEANRDFRVRQSRIGCILVLILMPAGSCLEYLIYPDLVWPIFKLRMLCCLAVALIFGLHYIDFGRRNVRVLTMVYALMPVISIAWMIYITEGRESPYYAGLTLMLTGVSVILPWTVAEAVIFCFLVLSMYISAGMLNHGPPTDTSIFGSSIFFLSATSVLCVTACYYIERRRFQEFCLRHEVDIKNKALAESYDRLTEVDRLKSEFFANISHELRTPLTLIISPVEELLSRGSALPAATAAALQIVQKNALRLLKLINDLLEIIRLEEGRTVLQRQPMNLASFVPAMIDSVRHLAGTKNLAVSARGEKELIVEADPERMEKVVLNILTNAIKFTPAGGSISASWWQREGNAVVEFADTGVGIPEKDLPFIFDRFRQADGSSTRKFQGVGIGLALAKDLVRQHGGALSARSEVGRGTTLRVELPLANGHASRPAEAPPEAVGLDPIAQIYRDADRIIPQEPEQSPCESPIGSGASTILVVDDEPDMRQFLCSTLATEHRVFQAADGKRGLAMVREHRPDLVLLDLMLPEMDGLDVCQAIRDDPVIQHTKVVLLTARTDEQSKIAALQRGADDFLTKPFSTTEVRTRLANLLRAARLEEDLRERNRQIEEAMEKLKAAEVQLVQSEKMSALGKLAAGLLHEVNNPLNFTLTALQVARGTLDPKDSELAEILNDMQDGMNRIRDIVSDLRAFAHPPAEAERDRIDLREALTTAKRLAAHELKGLPIDASGLCEALVLVSRTQITHVFMNLLVNSAQALHAMADQRQPQIRINSEAADGRLRVRVWDNGAGIKPADLPRVFEPFFTTKDVGQGMGLGLSICHTIVRNHGGAIAVRSEHGKWTEVSFDLPLA